MRTAQALIVFWVVFLLATAATAASASRESLVVSASWLAAHLSDPDLVLLHVGDKDGYAKHISGARYVTLADISVSDHSGNGLMLEMPPAEDLRQRLATLGISDRSRIVVYYGKDWVSPSTRVIFTLDYAGLGDRSSLLDGGMDAWVRDGHPVTDVVPPAKTGTLAPLKINPIVVDGRAAVYYDGIDTGGSKSEPQRTGHIAGARSVPFTSVFDDKQFLRSPAELAEIFAKAGVKPGDTIVGYCHIGQQATAVLFAGRTLGHPVLLYDGSFQDWSRHADYPVDNPAEKGRP